MVIPVLVLLTFSILVMVGVGKIYFQLHPGWDHGNRKFGYCFSALIAIGIVLLITLPMKTLVIIENDPQKPLTPIYKVVYCYGNPIVRTNCRKVDTKDYSLRNGKKYILNLTHFRLRYYPMRYVFKGLIGDTASKDYSETLRTTTYIEPYNCMMVPAIPDLWFCDPPKELDRYMNRYERLWSFLFGTNYVKWCLTR